MLDRKHPPIVRKYSMTGAYLGDVGRFGEGPGEYENPQGLAVGEDDALVVRDVASVEFFDEAGRSTDSWKVERRGPFGLRYEFAAGRDGILWLPVVASRTDENPYFWEWAVAGYDDSESVVEFREVPYIEPREKVVLFSPAPGSRMFRRIPFEPTVLWTFTSSEVLIVGHSQEYDLTLIQPDGAVEKVSRKVHPTPVLDEEGEWHLGRFRGQLAGAAEVSGWDASSTLRDTKPYFVQVVEDAEGRIWVFRAGPGEKISDCGNDPLLNECWRDTLFADVFGAKGTFFGRVALPANLRPDTPPAMHGSYLIAHLASPSDDPLVAVYRVEVRN